MQIESVSLNQNTNFKSNIVKNKFITIGSNYAKKAIESNNPAHKELGMDYAMALVNAEKNGRRDNVEFDFVKSRFMTAIGYEVCVDNYIKSAGHFLNESNLLGQQCCRAVVKYFKNDPVKVEKMDKESALRVIDQYI